MSKKTRTLDDSTYASDPGRITLSHKKLRILRPDLYGLRGLGNSILSLMRVGWPQRIFIAEQLHGGDSRAAVVVSTDPLLVAAYTDELDCIAMLRFPAEFVPRYDLSTGSRLLTVNTYKTHEMSPEYDADLIPGPNLILRWTGFHPVIADFVTDDVDRLEARKQQISEDEWQRTQTMGAEYLKCRPGIARDGRPVYSLVPASAGDVA